jgi:hypothetical protein
MQGVEPYNGYGRADPLIGLYAANKKRKPVVGYQGPEAGAEKKDADKIEFAQTG